MTLPRWWFVLWIQLLSTGAIPAQTWPTAPKVEAQPLLAQVKRLSQAMDSLGQPLPENVKKSLADLDAEKGNEKVSAEIQKQLDALSLLAVELGESGVVRVVPNSQKMELVEQGWRSFLVKVVNPKGLIGTLRPESPNALPVPGGPKDEVEKRWLSLLRYAGQPLLPDLSGLELEYIVVQLYSRDAGEKSAEIRFRFEQDQRQNQKAILRRWKFDKDADGWEAQNQCKLETAQESLKVTSTGNDPYFATTLTAKKGPMTLRFWAKFEKGGVGQVFWWTTSRKQTDGQHVANFRIEEGRGIEYVVRFNPEDDLAGIRLDPGSEPGIMLFDWMVLGYSATPDAGAISTVNFTAKPSFPVTFKVTEFDGTPAMGCFVIQDIEGRIYPAQSKRLAPDFFFQQQIYRATGETVRLPAGKYIIGCSRGPESILQKKELVIIDKPATLTYSVDRWIDPSKLGWWSGDHHIHAAGCAHYDKPTEGVEPSDMLRHILGEDLKVGCCLTWGPCFDYQKRFFLGKPDPVSKPPYLLRYDVEVSGFGSHASGHLNLLNLQEQIYPGGDSKSHWPTLGMNTLRWAKKQGAITGPAHSGNGLTRVVGRIEGAKDGPNRLPNYDIPAYDGIGANEFIVDVTHELPGPDKKLLPAIDFISTMDTDRVAEWNMWYHVLNCGFRTRASGETDFPCITGERVGKGRVYVKLKGEPNFDEWVKGLAAGRSYVSDGYTHLMDFTAQHKDQKLEIGTKGSEIALKDAGKMSFRVTAAARYPLLKTVPMELIVNGVAVAKQEIVSDGKPHELSFDTEIAASSWAAIRVFPSAHTNPFFIEVDKKPIRASKESAMWCLAGVEQCWKMKQKTYHKNEQKQAEADYDHAKKIYQTILKECEGK